MPRNLIVGQGFDGKTPEQYEKQTDEANEVGSIAMQPLRDKRKGAEEPAQKPGVYYAPRNEDARALSQFEVPTAVVPARAIRATNVANLPHAEVTGIYDGVVEGTLNNSRLREIKSDLRAELLDAQKELSSVMKSMWLLGRHGREPSVETRRRANRLRNKVDRLEGQINRLTGYHGPVTQNAAGERIVPSRQLPPGDYTGN